MKIEHAYILHINDANSLSYMEECKASCEQYNIPVTPFLGLMLPTTTSHIKDVWGFNVNPVVDQKAKIDPVFEVWFKEQLCLTGHMAIWKLIAENHVGAVAVFEHDAIVKRNFLEVDVQDGEIAFLGYRVDHRDDYECVEDPFVKHSVSKFEGTHGYAITPWTARACLNALNNVDMLPLGVSIDHMLGIRNLFNLKMNVVDPAPLVAVVEDKISYTQPENKVARYNMIPHDGFLKGIKNHEKYKVDYKNNWLTF